MKAYEVIGHAYDGAVYCIDCGLPDGVTTEDAHPVFAGDEGAFEMTCDVCHCKLEDTL